MLEPVEMEVLKAAQDSWVPETTEEEWFSFFERFEALGPDTDGCRWPEQ